MADKKLDKLLGQAQKAYQKGDKRKGARFIDRVLRQNFAYPPAWQLLYRLYGSNRTFEDFQRAFVGQFYPDKLEQLANGPVGMPPGGFAKADEAPLPPPKPGFFARLFGRQAALAPETPSPRPDPDAAPSQVPFAVSSTRRSPPPPPPDLPRTETTNVRPVPMIEPRPAPAPKPPPLPTPTPTPPTAIIEHPPEPSAAPTPAPAERSPGRKISILVVDDIGQTRENVIRSLRFQDGFEVIGQATNGLQAIDQAHALKPDVIVMDVNMPDMDGIAATALIKRDLPFTQIIILTVQDDIDYIRRAMLAGARDFLAKPPMIDELVAAVERAGDIAHRERQKLPEAFELAQFQTGAPKKGKIISVYSPRGGAGCTTLAANLAAALHSTDTPAVLVDGDLQFGDLLVLYNLQSKNTILELAPRAEELDQELVESVLVGHPSGVKILAPPRPEQAEIVIGPQFSRIVNYFAEIYSYVIVDTAHRLSDITLAALDASDLILLLVTQDIPCIARARKFLDITPLLNLDISRIMTVMNQFDQRIGITAERLGQALGQDIPMVLPGEYELVMQSINRGAPYMLQKETSARAITRATLELADLLRNRLDEARQA